MERIVQTDYFIRCGTLHVLDFLIERRTPCGNVLACLVVSFFLRDRQLALAVAIVAQQWDTMLIVGTHWWVFEEAIVEARYATVASDYSERNTSSATMISGCITVRMT